MQGPLSKMVLTQSVLGCSLPSRQKGIWQPCLDFFRLNKEHNYWLDNKHVTWQNTHAINTEGLLLKRTPKWFTYTGVNHHLDCVLCSTVLCHESISTAAVSFGPPEKACFLLKSWVWVVIFGGKPTRSLFSLSLSSLCTKTSHTSRKWAIFIQDQGPGCKARSAVCVCLSAMDRERETWWERKGQRKHFTLIASTSGK